MDPRNDACAEELGEEMLYGSGEDKKKPGENRIDEEYDSIDDNGDGESSDRNYNHKKTACKHEEVDYLPRYQGMTDEEVRSHIMPLLAAKDDNDDVPTPSCTISLHIYIICIDLESLPVAHPHHGLRHSC